MLRRISGESTTDTVTPPSKKRRSPSSSTTTPSPFQQKLFTKRTALFPNPSPAAAATAAVLPPPPPLQRSLSEPISDSVFNSMAVASTQLLKTLSLENSKNDGGSTTTANKPMSMASLPPLPPPLRRTSSAPIPSDYQILATPPPSPAAGSFSPSPSPDRESSDSKRLKRMEEKMQEMTEWCYQVIHEEQHEEEAIAEEDDCNTKDGESDYCIQEAVWVDKTSGGDLMMHFKCPCGKKYEECFLALRYLDEFKSTEKNPEVNRTKENTVDDLMADGASE